MVLLKLLDALASLAAAPALEDGAAVPSEVDVGRCDVVQALVMAMVILVIDEGFNPHIPTVTSLHCTKGGLEVTWTPESASLRASIGANLEGALWVDVATPDVPTTYASFVDAIRNGRPAVPDFRRGALLQRVLDTAESSAAQQSVSLSVSPKTLVRLR